MIIFDGIKITGNVGYLALKNDGGNSIQIPIPKKLAEHIMLYVQKISPPLPISVERGNEQLDSPE